MNAILALVVRTFQNKHTSLASALYVTCKLGAIWLPKWKAQFEATEGVAVAYGLLMAGDAKAVETPPPIVNVPVVPPAPKTP